MTINDKKSGNVLVFVLGFIAVVSISLAGYLFFQNQNLQNPKTESVTPTPTPMIKDETTNWKTYTNKNLGFSVDIPENETVKESAVESDWKWASFEKTGLMIAGGYPSIGNPVFKKLIKSQKVELKSGIVLEVMLYQWGNSPFEKDGFSDNYEISIAKNADFTHKFYVSAKLLNSNLDENFNLIVKILETFRFLDNKTNWKTYTNEKYGFSFKYPDDWSAGDYRNILSISGIDHQGLTIFYDNSDNVNGDFWKVQSKIKLIDEVSLGKTTIKIGEKTVDKEIFGLKLDSSTNIPRPKHLISDPFFVKYNNDEVIWFGKLGLLIKFYNFEMGGVIYEKNIKIGDQILGTFKFIN